MHKYVNTHLNELDLIYVHISKNTQVERCFFLNKGYSQKIGKLVILNRFGTQ